MVSQPKKILKNETIPDLVLIVADDRFGNRDMATIVDDNTAHVSLQGLVDADRCHRPFERTAGELLAWSAEFGFRVRIYTLQLSVAVPRVDDRPSDWPVEK